MILETYTPNAKQREFHTAPQKYVLLLGAAGSGKSLSMAWQVVMTALEYPGSTGVIARASYPALRDTTKRTFLEEACPPELIAEEVKSEGREMVLFHNGSRVMFRCFDSATKLGSQQFDYVAVDEVVEVEERIFLTLIARLRGKIGPRRLWAATNPPDEDHYLHRFFVDDVQKEPRLAADRLVIHSSTYDNAANLPRDYLKELEGYPAAWREKYLYGRWGFLVDGKPVFESYDPTIHVKPREFDAKVPLIRGWDFGRRHPACVWLQVWDRQVVHVHRELLGTDIELRDFARHVLDLTQREFPHARVIEDYCDVAGTQKNDRGPTSVQVLRHEFGLEPFCRKYLIMQSVEQVSGLLRLGFLTHDVSCRWLTKGFRGGYAMDVKTDLPAKDGVYDNIMDALRYAVCATTDRVTGLVVPMKRRPTWRMAV